MDAVLAILCVLFAYGALCLGVFILGAFLGGSPEFNGAVAVALPLGILLFISKRIESRVGIISSIIAAAVTTFCAYLPMCWLTWHGT